MRAKEIYTSLDTVLSNNSNLFLYIKFSFYIYKNFFLGLLKARPLLLILY